MTDSAASPGPDRIDELLMLAFGAEITSSETIRASSGESPPDLGSTRYQLLREIGRGGMGRVFLAADHDLGREVAIKLLRDASPANRIALRRFLEEAQIAGQLQHPGVVPVYDLGVAHSGEPFLVMKCVRGTTLSALLRQPPDARPTQDELFRILTAVAHTLAYAHARGVIHRDVKPGNVMVGAFGEVQLMDWGLARLHASTTPDLAAADPSQAPVVVAGSDDGARSSPGSVLGTPNYMAPEQARGALDEVDARADVFALGAMLCEILTGSGPYAPHRGAGATPAEIVARLALAHERMRAADAAREFAELAIACTAPRPEDRPADAGEVARRLTVLLNAATARTRAAELDAARAEARARGERRARRMTQLLAAALALLVAGVYWQRDAHAARRRTIGLEVQRGLGEAERLAAGTPAGESAERLRTALAAISRAEAALAIEHDDADLAATVAARRAELERRLAAAEATAAAERRDAAMLERLQGIRLAREGGGEFADKYAKAFRDYGLDLRLPDPVLIERLQRSAIRKELQNDLLRWAFLERGRPLRGRLKRLALEAESDPMRRELMQCLTPDQVLTVLDHITKPLDGATRRYAASRLSDLGAVRASLGLLRNLDPASMQDPLVHLQCADCLHRLGLDDAAFAEARIAEALEPQSFSIATRATAMAIATGAEDAEARLQRLQQQYDADPLARQHSLHPVAGLAFYLSVGRTTDRAWPLAERAMQDGLLDCSWAQILARHMSNAGAAEPALALFRYAWLSHRVDIEDVGHAREFGRQLYAMRRFGEALEVFEVANVVRPGDAETLEDIAKCLSGLVGKGASLASWERAARMDPGGSRLRNYLQLLAESPAVDTARAIYAEAVRRHPLDPDLHTSFADGMLRSGHFEDALAAYGRASSLDPGRFTVWRGLEVLAILRGDCAAAEAMAARRCHLPPDADWLDETAREMWRLRRPTTLAVAGELLQEAVRLDPTPARLATLRDFFGQRGDYETALQASRKLLREDGSRRTVERHCALLNLTGRVDEAFELALANLWQEPVSPVLQSALEERSNDWESIDRVATAVLDLRASSKLPPSFHAPGAKWLVSAGMPAEALQLLAQAPATAPASAEDLLTEAWLHLLLGEREAAAKVLASIPIQARMHPLMRETIARDWLQVADCEQAARWLQSLPRGYRGRAPRALDLLRNQVALGLRMQRDEPITISELGDAGDPNVLAGWAELCCAMDRPVEAAAALRRLLTEHGEQIPPLERLEFAGGLAWAATADTERELDLRIVRETVRAVVQMPELDWMARQTLRMTNERADFAALRSDASWPELWSSIEARLMHQRSR